MTLEHRYQVEVEHAPGPGVDLERDGHGGLVGRRARKGSVWLGYDRAALVDSDDGSGRRLQVLVALPASTFVGCRLEVELLGALQRGTEVVLVAGMPCGPTPQASLARVAANVDGGSWVDGTAAERIALEGRRRDRERRSHGRVRGGRAWHAIGALPPELARFATPHSRSEYSLATLAPRFVRGLEGLLDDDERVLYWIERPMVDPGVLDRLRRGIDRRAAVLALTDRQLLWIVDHAQPDRYLSDWGVDVELVPIERLVDAVCGRHGSDVELTVTTPAGVRSYELPVEFEAEIGIMRDLLARFTPAQARDLPRRSYGLHASEFDGEVAARFGQMAEAQDLYVRAANAGEVLGFFYSPPWPGRRRGAAIVVRRNAIETSEHEATRRINFPELPAISLTLSPLIGRIGAGPEIDFTYPASLADRGAALVRVARRALAMAP